MSRAERSALCAAIGTGVGVAFTASLGVFAIAVFAVVGAIVGMAAGRLHSRGEDEG